MPATPHLHLEGRLVATAGLIDSYRHDRDEWHQLFLFRQDDGYTLVTIARSEADSGTGRLAGGVLDVLVDHPSNVRELEDLVTHRWPARSDAWWQLLDAGRHHDEDLYVRWAPDRIRRDLDRASLFDRRLAGTTRLIEGKSLLGSGRAEDGWQQSALEAMAQHLEKLDWKVQSGRSTVADSAEPGGIPSQAAEIVGALRVRRYGWEAPILVRVDDCGEVYPRLAEPGEVANVCLRMVDGPDHSDLLDIEIAERLADLVDQLQDPVLGFDR